MHLSHSAVLSFAFFLLVVPAFSDQPDNPGNPSSVSKTQPDSTAQATSETGKKNKNWRKDPTVLRRPGSYLGGGLGYSQGHVWYVSQHGDATNEKLYIGPAHCNHLFIRVGDAFREWFALGFQIDIVSTINREERVSAFGLLLDTTFYPWRGLGIRPSAGLGFAYVEGKSSQQYGYGWPANLSLTFTYEIRITRHFVIAPFAQAYWITGKNFNGLFYCFGIEFLRWFKTATG
jgi:hypothetical protein